MASVDRSFKPAWVGFSSVIQPPCRGRHHLENRQLRQEQAFPFKRWSASPHSLSESVAQPETISMQKPVTITVIIIMTVLMISRGVDGVTVIKVDIDNYSNKNTPQLPVDQARGLICFRSTQQSRSSSSLTRKCRSSSLFPSVRAVAHVGLHMQQGLSTRPGDRGVFFPSFPI